jgi:GrpB-like predicted nucleotidyltransferase (UPF0157 family)
MVEIVDYEPAWPKLFRAERRRIQQAIPHLELRIEHVGSTAVPNLAAKPIVDILIGVPRLRDAVDCVPRLSALGYRYVPGVEVMMPYRRFFCKQRNGCRTHHVHVLEPEHQAWERHLRFRDYLRTHPDVAREYARLKRRLALKYRFAISSYTHGKTEFIHSVLERAQRGWERRLHTQPAVITAVAQAPEQIADREDPPIPVVQTRAPVEKQRDPLKRPPVTYETVLHAIAQVI